MKSSFLIPPGASLEKWAAFARDQGIDGVEQMFFSPQVSDFRSGAESARILSDHGVEAAAVAIWEMGLADPKSKGSAEVLQAAMDYAAELHAWCIFTGTGEPRTDDSVGALADVYPKWDKWAGERGLKLAVYLGHKGSFIRSEAVLSEACARIPGLGLKLDPIGLLRNVHADPYQVLFRYGGSVVHFHVKDRLILPDGEIEPPPGQGELKWGQIFGLLYHHSYDGYISVEPHGASWANEDSRRKDHIRLTLRHLSQFML
jgi:sugar phosphate isomerase/epimerase